ncbi:MAG TPA: hypothetical protein VFA32_20210 [Dehalococcoidia bacterium]|nr:hypothetical protein [Dehalococcoidia bacterium]
MKDQFSPTGCGINVLGQALKAKIAVALHDELGRVPKKEEIEQVFLLARVLYKAILGLHYKRQEQKKTGQLAIF